MEVKHLLGILVKKKWRRSKLENMRRSDFFWYSSKKNAEILKKKGER